MTHLRFRRDRARTQALLESLVHHGGGPHPPPRVAVIVAHADDEAIGAGVLLTGIPDATILHITDSAPANPEIVKRRGFATREEYRAARAREVRAALEQVGIGTDRLHCLGYVDGKASDDLVGLTHAVSHYIAGRRPDIVLTHPYEGGHTDHDATAFAVHLACGLLMRESGYAPLIVEMTSYHNRDGRRVTGEFLPYDRPLPKGEVVLGDFDKSLKARMYGIFETQWECLQHFPIVTERFRIAPRYRFTLPPHAGPLNYERNGAPLTGETWRARAARALERLRTPSGSRDGQESKSSPPR